MGGGDDTFLLDRQFTTGNTAWSFYQGTDITALGNPVRFGWQAVSSTGGDDSFGNFLEGAAFGVGVGIPIPVPAPLPVLAPGLVLGTLLKARRRYRALTKPE